MQKSNPMKSISRLCFVVLIASLLATTATRGDVAFVNASAKPGGDGTSWKTAFNDLQDAIDLARNAKYGITQIWVAAGVYKPDRGSGDRDATYEMLNGVALYGGFVGDEENLEERDHEANETILSADLQDNDVPDAGIVDPTVFDNSFHVLVADSVDATARLDGFWIVGGTAHGSPFPRNIGGGIFINSASPRIENCKFVNNKGIHGGAIRVLGIKEPWFVNCDFIDSYSNNRGGAIQGLSTFIVIGCEFVGSYAGLDGGAIYRPKLVIDCTFVNNISIGNGGAIWAHDAQIVDCIFLGNSSAIFCKGSSEITNCVFTDNSTHEGSGAAIYNDFGNIVVKDCAFTNNGATVSSSGGAIRANGSMEINNSSFESNSALRGGAIYAATGSITNCSFRNNSSSLRGGAIFTSNSLDILNCGFLGNSSAENGGALYVDGSTEVFLDNDLFSGNVAVLDGGAIHGASESTSIQIVNCSINANTSGSNGGGLFNNSGTADITNSIFWNNSDVMNGSNEAAQIFNGPIGTLSINYSLIENLTGNLGGLGNIGVDPMFVDADGVDNIPGTIDDDLHLMPGSPCIDAADNSAVLLCVLDLDSSSRLIDDPATRDSGVGNPPIVDMGSYEFGGTLLVDCNYNGLWDDCEIIEQLTPDCNENMIPDECDIDGGFSEDCNLNGIPDECDILDIDCNGNGIPDDCDIDCNFNGIPDDCDIADETSLDCNKDGVLDECQSSFNDCNQNGVADECEIAEGLAEDCNKNGVPDDCDLTGIFSVDSGVLSPLGDGFPHSILLSNLPIAMSDVTLSFMALSDLGSSGELVVVHINNNTIGIVFNGGSDAGDCPASPNNDQLIISSAEFNALVTDGTAIIDLVTTSSVDSFQCADGTFIRMTLQYSGFESQSDLNKNGIPDECDIPGDLNGDGCVSTSDLLVMFSVWGLCMDCDACLGDIDGNCNVGTSDLLILFANWGPCP